MNDASGVRHIERIGHLGGEVHDLFDRNWLAFDAVLQRSAFQALHDDVEPVLILADVVNGADVGMVQRGCGAGFTLKALAGLGILRQIFRKKLERYTAAETLILSFVDHAHSATAELRHDAVMGDCLSEHVAAMLTDASAGSKVQPLRLVSGTNSSPRA